MISKKLRAEGKLDPPPDHVLVAPPRPGEAAQDDDADMYAPSDNEVMEVAPEAGIGVDDDVDMEDRASPSLSAPSHTGYKEPKHGVSPNYLLKYRNHEAFSIKSSPERTHCLPRKGPTTKLGPKAKQKKQKGMLIFVRGPDISAGLT